jgi:hypothetical protein
VFLLARGVAKAAVRGAEALPLGDAKDDCVHAWLQIFVENLLDSEGFAIMWGRHAFGRFA